MSFSKTCIQKYSTELYTEQGTDKCTTHSYGDFYDALFQPRINNKMEILEIGVCSGGFLQAMSDYMPNAEIHGVDITLANVRYGHDNPMIHLYEMDGTVPACAERFEAMGKTFDIIIDDGSHMREHQHLSYKVFARMLKDDGIYVIEDVDGTHLEWLVYNIGFQAEKQGHTIKVFDLRHKKQRYDDIIITLAKPGICTISVPEICKHHKIL